MNGKDYMNRALELARQALERDEVPVGAVVVVDGGIAGEGFDQREATGDPTAHAEMIAIRAAAARLGRWQLDGAELYVTLEPCPMCAGAILQARIAHVYWGADSPKWGAVVSHLQMFDTSPLPHQVFYTSGLLADEASELLSRYFERIRK